MFRNYFKTAWRNLMKNKMFSFINILGLTIGITVCMMIFLFIMNLQSAITTIKDVYTKVAPVYPFEYTFLDQKFDDLYKADMRQQTILSVFAGLAIFIACLGLFGLASFTATKRFKEIGVRKVLGSSVQNIVTLLSKDLLKPVIIATCIAMPIGYWAMNK